MCFPGQAVAVCAQRSNLRGGGWKLLEGSVWGAPGRGGLLWRDASGQGAPW